MCGIVGVMTDKLSLGDYLRFKDLFTLAQLRGDDGAGVAAVPRKANVEQVRIRKTTWSSGHLVTTADFDQAVQGENSILIGHARQPTKGGSKKEFVHPHSSGNIVLVHNGTMNYVDGKNVPANESDSKMIAKTIAEKGIKGFVQNSFGAACLVWVDMGNQTLNFWRNRERPLWFLEQTTGVATDNVTHLWWSSELWMIHQALARYSGFQKDCVKSYTLPENEHHQFPLSVGMFVSDPVVEKVEKIYPTYTHKNYGYYEGWEDEFDQDLKGGTANQSVVPFHYPANNSGGRPNSSNSGSVTTNEFRYTPPEYRNSGTSGATTSVIAPGRILDQSKKDAELAAAQRDQKEKLAKAGTFRTPDKCIAMLDKYSESNTAKVLSYINSSPCIWCEEKPRLIEGVTKIYPVRFAQNRKDYACDVCITDLDIQRMVGIG